MTTPMITAIKTIRTVSDDLATIIETVISMHESAVAEGYEMPRGFEVPTSKIEASSLADKVMASFSDVSDCQPQQWVAVAITAAKKANRPGVNPEYVAAVVADWKRIIRTLERCD